MKKLVLMAILSISSPAYAANWVLISTATDRSKTYLDVSSIVSNGNYKTTWEKIVEASPRPGTNAYSIDHWKYDCSSRTVGLLSYATYDANGSPIKSYTVPSYSVEMNDVVPDSIGEGMFKVVCG